MLGRDVHSALKADTTCVALGHADMDVCNRKSVRDRLGDLVPEVIVNCAAYTKVDQAEDCPDDAFAVNAEGCGNVARAAAELNAMLIHISTDYVFKGQNGHNGKNGQSRLRYTENDPTDPINVYGKSKLAGEENVRHAVTQYYILRVSGLYGFYGKNFVTTMISKAKSSQQVNVVNDQIGVPTYTMDVAHLIRDLILNDYGQFGIYHVNNSGETSWFDLAKFIYEKHNADAALVRSVATCDFPCRARRPAYSVMHNAKITTLTGSSPRPWMKALDEFLKEFPIKTSQTSGNASGEY